MNKLFYFYKYLVALGLIISMLPVPITSAAELATLNLTGPVNVVLNQTFSVQASVTSNTSINAVEGHISYEPGALEVMQVRAGNSILKYWQQNPVLDRTQGLISFTGGLPTPGFTGNAGELVTLILKAKQIGTTTVKFVGNNQVLANDGNGTALTISTKPIVITVTQPTPGTPVPTPTITKDLTAPTDLELIVAHHSELFFGDWFAVFQARDVDSGIDHYEIAETDPNISLPKSTDWKPATSPYRLEIQDRDTKVFLKAIDKENNQSITSVLRRQRPDIIKFIYILLIWPNLLWLLLIPLLLCLYWIYRKRKASNASFLNSGI